MSETILVVDDAAFMRVLIREVLVPEGFVVHEAVNGRDAIEKYAELRPDLVTMDVTMPGVDGIAALRAIRAEDAAARVLMITAAGERRAGALEAGAVGFLHKPFQPVQVLAAVRSCLHLQAG